MAIVITENRTVTVSRCFRKPGHLVPQPPGVTCPWRFPAARTVQVLRGRRASCQRLLLPEPMKIKCPDQKHSELRTVKLKNRNELKTHLITAF